MRSFGKFNHPVRDQSILIFFKGLCGLCRRCLLPHAYDLVQQAT
jgi:hypothetical protein